MPERIVSLGPSITAILWGMGAQDQVVGVSKHCSVLTPEAANLPQLGDCWSATAEEVLALNPDLVIGCLPYHPETTQKLIRGGFRFFAMYPKSLKDTFEDIQLLGDLTGHSFEASRLVETMKSEIEKVREQTRNAANRPRIYCEEWIKPLMASPGLVKEMVEIAGGTFVPERAASIVESEEIIQADPELIVLAWCGAVGRSNPKKVYEREGWGQVQAVAEKKVYAIPDQFFNSPCQHLITGLHLLSKILH